MHINWETSKWFISDPHLVWILHPGLFSALWLSLISFWQSGTGSCLGYCVDKFNMLLVNLCFSTKLFNVFLVQRNQWVFLLLFFLLWLQTQKQIFSPSFIICCSSLIRVARMWRPRHVLYVATNRKIRFCCFLFLHFFNKEYLGFFFSYKSYFR